MLDLEAGVLMDVCSLTGGAIELREWEHGSIGIVVGVAGEMTGRVLSGSLLWSLRGDPPVLPEFVDEGVVEEEERIVGTDGDVGHVSADPEMDGAVHEFEVGIDAAGQLAVVALGGDDGEVAGSVEASEATGAEAAYDAGLIRDGVNGAPVLEGSVGEISVALAGAAHEARGP